jgi:adenylate kinase family enzyme
MERVAVVGSPGSGKSTLARALAHSLGLAHVELDALFHGSDWQPATVPAFRAAVTAALAGDGWVADGNYRPVSDLTQGGADTIVWLDLPRWQVTWRVLRRTAVRLARREQLWNGNRETLRRALSRDPEQSIIVWTWQQHPKYRALFERQAADGSWAHAEVVRLRSSRGVRSWCAEVTGAAAG